MRPVLPPLSLAALLALPCGARAACPDPADRLFAHPYGEPSGGCGDEMKAGAETDDLFDHPSVLDDPRQGRRLQILGISGMGAGAGLAGLGAASLVGSLAFDSGRSLHGVLRGFGIGAAIAGGAVFLSGVALVGIDALVAPAPTADRRGGQLTFACRF